jgi:hypothetical protein
MSHEITLDSFVNLLGLGWQLENLQVFVLSISTSIEASYKAINYRESFWFSLRAGLCRTLKSKICVHLHPVAAKDVRCRLVAVKLRLIDGTGMDSRV